MADKSTADVSQLTLQMVQNMGTSQNDRKRRQPMAYKYGIYTVLRSFTNRAGTVVWIRGRDRRPIRGLGCTENDALNDAIRTYLAIKAQADIRATILNWVDSVGYYDVCSEDFEMAFGPIIATLLPTEKRYPTIPADLCYGEIREAAINSFCEEHRVSMTTVQIGWKIRSGCGADGPYAVPEPDYGFRIRRLSVGDSALWLAEPPYFSIENPDFESPPWPDETPQDTEENLDFYQDPGNPFLGD
jgi:hypothetical protein